MISPAKTRKADEVTDLAERYKEIAISIRRTMTIIVAFSILSLGVLFVHDEYLISEFGKVVKTSLLNLPISVNAFIFISPVFLLIITEYLNILLAELSAMHRLPEEKRFPIFLTFKYKKIAFLRGYFSSYHTIVVMLVYCWVISPHPSAVYFYIFACFVVLLFLYRKFWINSYFWKYNCVMLSIAVISITVIYSLYFNRGYNLERVTASKYVNLSGLDFSNVSLKYADFESVKIRNTNLSQSSLEWANMKKADLTSTNLEFANLTGVILEGATLANANLTSVVLNGANFKGANLQGAKLGNADFSSADLSGADMKDTDFWVDIGDYLRSIPYNEREMLYRNAIVNSQIGGKKVRKLAVKGLNCEQIKKTINTPKEVLEKVCNK